MAGLMHSPITPLPFLLPRYNPPAKCHLPKERNSGRTRFNLQSALEEWARFIAPATRVLNAS